MTSYKRPYNKKARKIYRKYGGKARVLPAATKLQAVVKRTLAKQLNKKLETKSNIFTTQDGLEILHNNFINLNTNLLLTTPGVYDPMVPGTVQCRIGDRINLKGVSLRMMVELNERYSDVSFRLLVIKSAKGDTPTRATLFTGSSGNKMIDTINKERYTVISQKWFKIRAASQGTTGADISSGTLDPASGTNHANTTVTLSRATRIIRLWIPGRKFNKGGVIQYENESQQPKFFTYTAVLYAYSNYTTSQDIFYVGRVNDFIAQMYYTDA